MIDVSDHLPRCLLCHRALLEPGTDGERWDPATATFVPVPTGGPAFCELCTERLRPAPRPGPPPCVPMVLGPPVWLYPIGPAWVAPHGVWCSTTTADTVRWRY